MADKLKISIFDVHKLSRAISLTTSCVTIIFLDDEARALTAWLLDHGYGPEGQP